MKNRQYVSRLILKKSSKFLNISIALFAFSLMLISLFLTSFFNQYLQIKRDFLDNSNIHIIEISVFNEEQMTRELNFSDLSNIKSLIASTKPHINVSGINLYQLNFGIEDNNDNIYFLYGVDDAGARFIDADGLEKDVLYSKKLIGEKTQLNIPIVKIEDGGLSSNDIIKVDFVNNTNVPEKTPFTLYETVSDQTYVSFLTYKSLIEKIYNIPWDEFVRRYNKENEFGIQAIYKIYLYIDDIKNVETVAKIVNDNGYATNFTFKSFDNFENSIKNTIFISAFLIFIVFLFTSSYIVLSFNSYLKVQQKDMGILKHHRYSNQRIKKIYSSNVNRIFILMSVFIIIFIFAITYLLLSEDVIKYFIIISTSVLIPLCIINRIISCILLNKYVKLDILELTKTNKEFE